MPTIEQNLSIWNNPDWSEYKDGEEWSASFGGTPVLWRETILPRIEPYLVGRHVCLEIACGHGRITNLLKEHFKILHAVDVSSNCIDFCEKRFTDSKNIFYHVNNGYNLPVQDGSINFVFSWDSLVHCEIDVVSSYINETYRVLKPKGKAFLHISNFGNYKGVKANRHVRAESVAVEEVESLCLKLGFIILNIERVKWGEDFENDAFLTIAKPD